MLQLSSQHLTTSAIPLTYKVTTLCLSSGASCNKMIASEFLNARKGGKIKKEELIRDRIESSKVDVFEPITTNEIKTMADNNQPTKKLTSSQNKVLQFKATSSLILQLIVKSELAGVQISLSHLMTYPLAVAPYALSTVDGAFAKTRKSALMTEIIDNAQDAALPPEAETAIVVDGDAQFDMTKLPGRMGQVAQ
jgi:hypothetical protein